MSVLKIFCFIFSPMFDNDCKKPKFVVCRVYKKDWERLRAEKCQEREKRKAQLEQAAGRGAGVPLINSISSGQEIADVYLKPSGDESSEDEDDEKPPDDADEEREEDSFKNFLSRHQDEQDKRATKQQEHSRPGTSKDT